MLWEIKDKLKKHSPKHGDIRVVKKFAWLPTTLSEPAHHRVWLSSYYITQERGGEHPGYYGGSYSFWIDLWKSQFHPNDWVNILEHSTPRAGSWIGFDLDGTLAIHKRGNRDMGHIGQPVESMVARAKRFLAAGWEVKIVTARAATGTPQEIDLVYNWCRSYIGKQLPVVAAKDPKMVVLFDDRAVGVESNTGKLL